MFFLTLSSIRRGSPFWPQARHCWLAKTTCNQSTKHDQEKNKIGTKWSEKKLEQNVQKRLLLVFAPPELPEGAFWEPFPPPLAPSINNITMINLMVSILKDFEVDIICAAPHQGWTGTKSPSLGFQWCLPEPLEKQTHTWRQWLWWSST